MLSLLLFVMMGQSKIMSVYWCKFWRETVINNLLKFLVSIWKKISEKKSWQLKATIKPAAEPACEEVTEKIAGLAVTDGSNVFEMIAAQAVAAPGTDQGQISAVLLAGNIEFAVEIAIKHNR